MLPISCTEWYNHDLYSRYSLLMFTPREAERARIWPAGIIALIAVIQLLLTFAILGIETTSAIFDLWNSMSFAGFYCPIFFMVTWISMFTVSECHLITYGMEDAFRFPLLACCNRGSLGCAIHVLVENIISIIAAAVLLYFNNLFLNNPYTCIFGSSYQCSSSYYRSSSYYNYYSNSTSSDSSIFGIYSTTGYTIKLACIKAELACAAVMLTTCVIYMIIFTVVAIRVRNINNQSGVTSFPQPIQPMPVYTVPYGPPPHASVVVPAVIPPVTGTSFNPRRWS